MRAEFSRDGRLLCTSGYGYYAALWDYRTGRIRHRLQHDGNLFAVAFSADARQVATGSDKFTAMIWGTDLGQPLCPPSSTRGKSRTCDSARMADCF